MSVERDAAKTLLDRGIKVRVTAPLCLRVIGKKTVGLVIRQPYLGTLIRISELFLRTGLSADDMEGLEEANIHVLYTMHGKTMAEIAAQAILNGRLRGKIFGGALAKWLLWNLNAIHLLTIAHVMASLNGATAFTTSIRLVNNMKVTSPTLSQTTEGS